MDGAIDQKQNKEIWLIKNAARVLWGETLHNENALGKNIWKHLILPCRFLFKLLKLFKSLRNYNYQIHSIHSITFWTPLTL